MLLLATGIVLILLVSAEYWWRQQQKHTEFSRKFIHITVGSFVAFWPFMLSWGEIQLISIAFLLAVAVSRRFKIFQAIHSVQRPTWGEFFFAIAVGGITLITHNRWIYLTALLQMSLADGLAAVVGVRYGKPSRYKVLGHIKSVPGSATFFVVSFALLVLYTHLAEVTVSPVYLVGLPLVTTLIENLGAFGLDNLLVPVVVAVVLKFVS